MYIIQTKAYTCIYIHNHIIYGGFLKWGYLYFMRKKHGWSGGNPILGNHHMSMSSMCPLKYKTTTLHINGNFRILKWRYVSTIFLAIFSGDIPLHRPYIGLIYGRYLQSIGSWNGHWSHRPGQVAFPWWPHWPRYWETAPDRWWRHRSLGRGDVFWDRHSLLMLAMTQLGSWNYLTYW